MQGYPRVDDHQFHHLLAHFGFSREGYRRVRKGVKKRLRRHMQALGCQHLACYLEAIEASPHTRSACLRRLSVPISRVMRDREFWDIMATRILPDLRGRFDAPLKSWSAGCACGEEAYSLAITAASSAGLATAGPAPLKILATDRNPAGLVRARAGIYPRSSFREMDPDRWGHYFIPLRGGRRYRIRTEFQVDIEWLCCEIERLPVSEAFHLLLVRNSILTYVERDRQSEVLSRVLDHLRPGGILAVGHRERLPAAIRGLRPCYGLPYVYEHACG